MARRKNQGRHSADSPQWSATRKARELIALRDLTIERGTDNPVVLQMEVSDLNNSIAHYTRVAHDNGSPAPLREALSLIVHDLDATDLSEEALTNACKIEWAQNLDDLAAADPYITSPQMHATTIAAAYTLTDEDTLRISVDDLPSPTGLLTFPTHMIVEPLNNGVPQDLAAISWAVKTKIVEGEPVRLLYTRSWLDTHGPVEVEAFTAFRKMAKEMGAELPPWTKLASTGVPLIDDVDDGEFPTTAVETIATFVGGNDTPLTASSPEVAAEYDTDTAIRDHDVHVWIRKYLMAFFRLADQRTATVTRFADGIHPSMKQQAHHDVRIAQLRPKTSTTGESGTTAYHHRFIVRMHRVNQWYPSQGRHKIIWRGPFIKGPDDAPMMKGTRVNALR